MSGVTFHYIRGDLIELMTETFYQAIALTIKLSVLAFWNGSHAIPL